MIPNVPDGVFCEAGYSYSQYFICMGEFKKIIEYYMKKNILKKDNPSKQSHYIKQSSLIHKCLVSILLL